MPLSFLLTTADPVFMNDVPKLQQSLFVRVASVKGASFGYKHFSWHFTSVVIQSSDIYISNFLWRLKSHSTVRSETNSLTTPRFTTTKQTPFNKGSESREKPRRSCRCERNSFFNWRIGEPINSVVPPDRRQNSSRDQITRTSNAGQTSPNT